MSNTENFSTVILNDAEIAWQANANNAYGYQVFQLPLEKLAKFKAECTPTIQASSTE